MKHFHLIIPVLSAVLLVTHPNFIVAQPASTDSSATIQRWTLSAYFGFASSGPAKDIEKLMISGGFNHNDGRPLSPGHEHPYSLFGMEAHTLYVYCELYNLRQGSGTMDKGLISTFTIKNSKGEEIKSHTIDNLKLNQQTFLLGKIPIHDLNTGRYQLLLHVTDLDSGESVEKSAVFNVVNAHWVMQKI